MSLVPTPDCNMLLNLIVNGNGNRTKYHQYSSFTISNVNSLMTKPLKKALIQLMIKVCGIIIVILPFIMPIIPSIAAGSVIGFAGAPFFLSGSFRYAPFSN